MVGYESERDSFRSLDWLRPHNSVACQLGVDIFSLYPALGQGRYLIPVVTVGEPFAKSWCSFAGGYCGVEHTGVRQRDLTPQCFRHRTKNRAVRDGKS